MILRILLSIAVICALLRAFLASVGLSDLHFHRPADERRVRVACMGDSVTNGALIPGCFFRCWPVKLEKMLGKGYQAENFGLNGRTLQTSADRPYTAEKEFEKALAFRPDIAVILLGTNDTKPVNRKGREAFEKEYRLLLDRLLNLAYPPKIVLCTPAWAVNAANRFQFITNDTEASLLPEIAEAVRSVAAEYGLPLVDLYAAFDGRRELLSYDGVHPNARGAQVIAEQTAEVIRNAEAGRI